MHLPTIRLMAAKEILELLRDRRTIISTILIPVLAMPLLIGGMVLVARNQITKLQQETITVVVRGADSAPGITEVLAALPRLQQQPDTDPNLPADSLIARGNTALVLECDSSLAGAFAFLRQGPDSLAGGVPAAGVPAAGIPAAGVPATGVPATGVPATGVPATGVPATGVPATGVPATGVPEVRVFYNSTEDEAAMAARELVAGLQSLRSRQVAVWLAGEGITEQAMEPWRIQELDVATEQRRQTELIARFLPYLILVLVVQSLAYPAMELTAGEKERHTIETLLVNPVSRADLVLGKFVAIATMGVGSTAVTLGSQLAFFMFLHSRMEAMGGLPFTLSPFAALVALLFLLPFTLFFAAVSLLVCLYARSMKEAQSYVAPMVMLVVFPSMMSMIPGLELSPLTALVPVYNVTLMLKQVLVQNWAQAPLMGLVFVANGVYAGIAILAAVRLFSRESVIFRS